MAGTTIDVGGSVGGNIISGDKNLVMQVSGDLILNAAEYSKRRKQRDLRKMLRVLVVLAAPVSDPNNPATEPTPLDLQEEWNRLATAVQASGAPIALIRLVPPTLDALRFALSPRAVEQGLYPHVLHFSGHAWSGGLLLEDEYFQYDPVSTPRLLAAWLSLAGIIYYVVLYSILLKKATVQNIVIGGGAGAIPPLVGWVAATGSLSIPAWILFLIVFIWTPPHFWALAIVRRKDYEKAGVPMLPVIRGEAETRKQVLIYTIELVTVTFLLPLINYTGLVYLISAAILGGLLLYYAWRVYKTEGNKVAWMMYRYSSMYLMFLFLALVVDALV